MRHLRQAVGARAWRDLYYDSYSRALSEGEFCINIAVPLLALAIVLIVRGGPLYLLALPIPVVLGYQGFLRSQRASDILVQALRIREVGSDAFPTRPNGGGRD